MENKYIEKVKRIFNEDNLDLAESKLDRAMDKASQISRVQKLMQHKRMQSILESKVAHDFNEHIAPHLKSLFLFVGWVLVASGVLGIFFFISKSAELGYLFSFGLGIGFRAILILLIKLISFLLSFVCGIGMIKMKRWLPSSILLLFLVLVLGLIISLIPSGFIVSMGNGIFGISFLNVLLLFVLVIIVFKNKQLFHK